MKIASVMIQATVLILAVTVVKASNVGTVILNDSSTVYPGNGGGEFTANTSIDYTGNYASEATYNGGFETFCIETGVEFTPGQKYYYTLGDVSQPIPAKGTGSALALTTGAAWLYYEFGTGNLDNFDYTYGSGRKADDNLLQAALWYLQGAQTYGSYPNGGTGNIYYEAAVSALGGSVSDPYNGTYVEVLQMWADSDDTIAAQNQLVLTGDGPPPIPHVPDGGMTVILLGGTLVGLQALRRKLCC